MLTFLKAVVTHSAGFERKTSLVSIQITTRLRHPDVWRFVGFFSTIVALLCYAFSSSFNHLFGHWNFAKLFAYIVLSVIICLATLFPKVWRHSPSIRFRTHMAFLALTITSVYSFFFDKAVNGKPDAYSLLSCVAFSMMSLSLSRQIHCGFEVDLLYFFLGALIVQLMKIHKLLGMVGVCFSYFLIILRSSLDAPQEDNFIRLQVQDQNHLVIQMDSQQPSTDDAVLVTNKNCIVTEFIASIGELQQRNSVLIHMILEHMNHLYDSGVGLVSDPNLVLDALPSGIIHNLHEAAKSTTALGFENEFLDAYIGCRRECLEECLLRRLELVKIGIKDSTTLPDSYDMIDRWIKASKVALKILLPSERRLCDRVFFGLSSAADLCFMEICREPTTQLLNFADNFANESHTLHQFLSIFEALCDLILDFKSLFCDRHTVCLVKEAVSIQNRLREAISISYKEERNLIFHSNEAKLDVPNSGVHVRTSKAINHIRFCCHSQKCLEPILQEYLKDANGAGTWSSFSEEMVTLLERLERKLRINSKNYKDPALRYLSMENNRRYIEKEIKDWDLTTHLSDEWIQNNITEVQQNLELFYRNSWNKVLEYLKLDKETLKPKVDAESMIERLILFNTHFTEMCSVQSGWFIADEQLREEMITSLVNIMLPAYGNFIGRLLDVLGTSASEYIMYGMFDIEARLKDLLPTWGKYYESLAILD